MTTVDLARSWLPVRSNKGLDFVTSCAFAKIALTAENPQIFKNSFAP